MQPFAVKSNLVVVDNNSDAKLESSSSPICPKPRRLVPALPEFLRVETNDHGQMNSEVRNGITHEKGEEEQCMLSGGGGGGGGCCLTSYWGSSSPPIRTDNPMVHDMQFVHQMGHFSRVKMPENYKLGFSSAPPPSA